MKTPQYVFGYGSLLEQPNERGTSWDSQVYYLNGFRRSWGVAMDNSRDLTDYKYYLNETGERPDLFVVFLNIAPVAGQRVNGTLVEVGPDELKQFDSRERNYSRVDVTAKVEPTPPGRVWAYVGKPEAIARFEHGVREGRAVIDRNYLEMVKRHFAALSDAALSEYEQLTEPPTCPVVHLRRIDHVE
jgi:hypothetical protein